MDTVDTIAAICTGAGGAISIIRISGSGALETGNRIWYGSRPLTAHDARRLLLGKARFLDSGEDAALAVYMPGPNSYTGDDIVEIQCHGGNLISAKVLEAALAHGARMAEPGEFTYRAFINGKMDLTQAEAVAEVISAGSGMALHLAEKQINGSLGKEINDIYEQLTDILSECESRMDFAEESLDWTQIEESAAQLCHINERLEKLLKSKTEGIILRNGVRVVIAGRPNAGKSSLLNLLLGYERAIVTQLPGTTRDTLEEQTHLRGVPVRLIDTAGIRDADNLIEGMGIDRSKRSINEAQVIFWLLDSSEENLDAEIRELKAHIRQDAKAIAIWNKIDLAQNRALPELDIPAVKISVSAEKNIDALLDVFEQIVWGFPHDSEPELAVSARHAHLLDQAVNSIPAIISHLTGEDWELAAVYLRESLTALGKITGKNATPDVLDNIFARFCIGK